ncbi:uncharacterized protein si:dkey-19b23.10 isoform X2 [Cheilinus undulatus]|uniref:uncharacterized protein si:dkey-19b23.10 isoform X2 n=1 Tax=Cheilinus undulatus TaxID=241271 RepID=UPI001BD4E9E9|nr:uncharacterized protein si:dkey-19b23.10 isoform X2 [Cheilinus undulatus]
MDNHSSTQSFHNHHHHQLPSFHLALPNIQSPEVGYSSSQHVLDHLEHDRSLLNASSGSLDGHADLGGHFDGESVRGGHFGDTLFGISKKEEVWEDGESCETASNYFYGKGSHTSDSFYTLNCGSEEKVNYNSYVDESKHEPLQSRDASNSHFMKQTVPYIKSETGSFSDGHANYCRTDSSVSDGYLKREEDYGSGEDQQQPAESEGPWPSVSPLRQSEEERWRGAVDSSSRGPSHRSPIGISSGVHTQKLDSFSEAFLSQRKIRFPMIPSGESTQQTWDFGERRGERHSCAFDSDPCLPPSSSSSPTCPSLPSFPSPPTSSHLMSSVLSPPPTPLPPPSHSPSKIDSPIAFGGYGHSGSQGGEPVSALQFFTPRLQCLPAVHTSGKMWKLPLLSNCFSKSPGNPSNMEGTLRSHGRDISHITVLPASHNIVQSLESSFHTASAEKSSFHSIGALCPVNTASLPTSLHLASHTSQLSNQHTEAKEKRTLHVVTQKIKNGPASLSQSQHQASQTYTGTPFPSILQSARGQKKSCYTPQPLLNPVRRGKGLYSCITSFHHREEEAAAEEGNESNVLPFVNVGHDFQAKLPPCFGGGEKSEVCSPGEESSREQLLWKPWVEKLLSMCSSSCLPGGGSNTELALHCLHLCKGDVKATLEMMLFSQPLPTGDYHYSGSDLWSDSEKNHFIAALETYGKDFALIQKLVRTKTTSQCVEFYYLSKKLLDKQKKQKEEEESRDGEMGQRKSITPICQPVDGQFGLEGAVPLSSLASFFPCKLCGKMFYKIKSRNAHMKIHRQPQEDWSDRRLQQQILTQRLSLGRPNNLIATQGSDLFHPQAPGLTFSSQSIPGTSNSNNNADSVLNSVTNSNAITPSTAVALDPSTVVTYSNIAASNSHVITNTHGRESNQGEPSSVSPFHQLWASFGPGSNPATFYYNAEGKDNVVASTVEGKEPINWQ